MTVINVDLLAGDKAARGAQLGACVGGERVNKVFDCGVVVAVIEESVFCPLVNAF